MQLNTQIGIRIDLPANQTVCACVYGVCVRARVCVGWWGI